jgi:hypothetical protein
VNRFKPVEITAEVLQVFAAGARSARNPQFRQLLSLLKIGKRALAIPGRAQMGHVSWVECGTWQPDISPSLRWLLETGPVPYKGPANALLWVRPSSSSNGSKPFESHVLLMPAPHHSAVPKLVSPTAFESMTSKRGWKSFNDSAWVTSAGKQVCRVRDFLIHTYGVESISWGPRKNKA